jgi:E3 ubiquitin-protein ligase RNF144
MELAGLDPVTAKLAVELQLSDINATLTGLTNNPPKGDELAAFQDMRDNLQVVLQILEGQVLALNILKSDHASRVTFERLMQEESQASRDHNMARQLAGLGSAPQASDSDESSSLMINSPELCPVSALTLGNSISTFGSNNDSILSFEESASPSKGKGKIQDHATHTLCCSCFELHPRFDVLELPCKREDEDLLHAYCRDCINCLFEACLRDTTLWPPRCCGVHISVYAAAHLLVPELVTKCETRDKELSTPNPTYCSNRSCAEWIPPPNIEAEVGKCHACLTETCATCKNPKHKGLCPKDEDVQQLMKYAGEQKYKRCFSCRTLVELEMGCNHIQ